MNRSPYSRAFEADPASLTVYSGKYQFTDAFLNVTLIARVSLKPFVYYRSAGSARRLVQLFVGEFFVIKFLFVCHFYFLLYNFSDIFIR